jgi:hypothetical protein
MSTEKSTLPTTIMVIDPDTIMLDSRGRFEMSEIIDISLLDIIAGGARANTCNNPKCQINLVAHCGG